MQASSSSRKRPQDGLKGFKVLPHALSSSSASSSSSSATDASSAERYVFYKKHTQKGSAEDQDAIDRTLFACNIPKHFDFQDVSALFSCFGSVESVLFQEMELVPSSQWTAVASSSPSQSAQIIFEETESVVNAMNSDMSQSVQPFISGSVACGMKKWLEEYKRVRPDAERLQASVDRFMEAFDQRTEQEKLAAKRGPVVDEEGFTLIMPKKKKIKLIKTPTPGSEPAPAKKKKKAKTQLVNFYRYQKREKKQQELAALRRKFEEDKKRVAELKSQRKFRPV